MDKIEQYIKNSWDKIPDDFKARVKNYEIVVDDDFDVRVSGKKIMIGKAGIENKLQELTDELVIKILAKSYQFHENEAHKLLVRTNEKKDYSK